MKLYRSIDVWTRKHGGKVARYRCLQSLDNGMYCVQSADFYQDGNQVSQLMPQSDRQFVELFTDQDPAERAGEHKTLEEAIAAHNRDFDEI
jgi:hypothetical protein